MSVTSSLTGGVRRPRAALAICAVALVFCGWSAFQYSRWAPVQTHIDKGLAFQNSGQSAAAESQWRQAVTLDPNSAQAWEFLGDLYLKQDNLEASETAFNNVLRIAPNTPDLKARLALVAYKQKDNSRATELAQSELKSNPNSLIALRVVADAERYVHPDVMLSALRDLSRLQPQSAPALDELITELQTRDAYDQIIPLADRLVKLDPTSSHAYETRGTALYIANPDANALTRAKQDLQKALQLDPNNIEAHRYLARLYLRQNEPRLAITEFEAVGKGRPYASAHWLELSQAYRRTGNIKRADELRSQFTALRELNTRWVSLTDKIKRDPKNEGLYLQMASLVLKRALGSDPNAYHLYGFQLARGTMFSVQQYVDAARQINPRNAQLPVVQKEVDETYKRYIQIGKIELQKGKYAQANEAIARALLIDTSDKTSLALARQVSGAGFDPFPKFSPEAVTTVHRR